MLFSNRKFVSAFEGLCPNENCKRTAFRSDEKKLKSKYNDVWWPLAKLSDDAYGQSRMFEIPRSTAARLER